MSATMRRLTAATTMAAAALMSIACGSSGSTVNVYAAASLTELLGALAEAFETEQDGVSIKLNFAGSTALATQIRQGAPATLYASANPELVGSLTDEGYVDAERLFAATKMVVAVRSDESTIDSLSSLTNPDLILVLAAEGVPAGDYARTMLDNADAQLGSGFAAKALANVRSFEPNVRAALLKVELGEADAAIVYETDVRSGSDTLRTVPIPDQFNVRATYTVALLEDARPETLDFYQYLASDKAAEIIRSFGFEALQDAN